ncbi:MAG: hypothetical protein ACJ72E_12400 [Marmoricola sp.]
MNHFPNQRTAAWADAHEATLSLVTEDDHVLELLEHVDAVRTAVPVAHEVGTWSLEYLGPGFHVQLRIARRQRQARIDGWMSPARPIKIFLSSLLRDPVVLEAQVSESGRFEFPAAPTGACRMSFVTEDRGRPSATPPFWI